MPPESSSGKAPARSLSRKSASSSSARTHASFGWRPKYIPCIARFSRMVSERSSVRNCVTTPIERFTAGASARTSIPFTVTRPAGRIDLRRLRRFVARVNAVQMDSVNVLVRAHYFPAFSRLGPYPVELLDRMAYERRELFEYWGHEASLMPVSLYPLFRARMERAKRGELWGGIARFARENKKYVDAVYAEVRERGPLA